MLSKEEEKAKLLETARGLPARDAIVIVGASWRGKLYGRVTGTPQPLTDDDAAPGANDADRAAANAVLARAGSYGEQWWSDDSAAGHQSVEEAIRKEHPGFLESTYIVALNLGCFQAR